MFTSPTTLSFILFTEDRDKGIFIDPESDVRIDSTYAITWRRRGQEEITNAELVRTIQSADLHKDAEDLVLPALLGYFVSIEEPSQVPHLRARLTELLDKLKNAPNFVYTHSDAHFERIAEFDKVALTEHLRSNPSLIME